MLFTHLFIQLIIPVLVTVFFFVDCLPSIRDWWLILRKKACHLALRLHVLVIMICLVICSTFLVASAWTMFNAGNDFAISGYMEQNLQHIYNAYDAVVYLLEF